MKKVALLLTILFTLPSSFCLEPEKAPLVKAAADSMLLNAAKKGESQKIKRILDNNYDPDIRDANGATPLMFASYFGCTPIVQMLLAARANSNLATYSNNAFSFGKLLSNKNSGTTALMLAAFCGKIEIVLALLKSGANPNAVDSDGQTALTYAILADKEWPHAPLNEARKRIIKLLLDFGANPTLCDKNGLNPVYYYSCVAGLVPGFGVRGFDTDPEVAENDPLYKRMKW
jgi:ankyrin repeat protein